MQFARLIQFLLELSRAKFYGEVHLSYRNGQIGRIERRETLSFDQLPIADEAFVELMQTGKFPAAP